MITYFPNATPEEQLNLWYNGNEEEVVLAEYLEGVYQEFYGLGHSEGQDYHLEQPHE
mgnify:FL=1